MAQDWIEQAAEIGLAPALTADEVLTARMTRGELLTYLFDRYRKQR